MCCLSGSALLVRKSRGRWDVCILWLRVDSPWVELKKTNWSHSAVKGISLPTISLWWTNRFVLIKTCHFNESHQSVSTHQPKREPPLLKTLLTAVAVFNFLHVTKLFFFFKLCVNAASPAFFIIIILSVFYFCVLPPPTLSNLNKTFVPSRPEWPSPRDLFFSVIKKRKRKRWQTGELLSSCVALLRVSVVSGQTAASKIPAKSQTHPILSRPSNCSRIFTAAALVW